ncbi:MAG: DUF2283 domain-containing protein [Nanoarchaeota archaeon]
MTKDTQYDYEPELDILHVYSSEIQDGIKGCLSIGDFNIDVGTDNKIIGIEVEEASKNLRLKSDVLSSLDNADIVIRKTRSMLFMGVGVTKGLINSSVQMSTPSNNLQIQTIN